ncbi:MAG TPA: hypothetical protein DIW80_19460 [Gordonia polyisoprenivorans]|uniref:hypothetical protein n=1 Tax=uncultured Gordonia sp. TaxID=198437 RepID=UPI000EEDA58D|nr:hypothetical protein [uncultured Gordonia sp.]HCS59062.1 hypothetical protein [Gordonia polyisoprenivorans]
MSDDTTPATPTSAEDASPSPAEMPATTPERHAIDLDRAKQLRAENKSMRDRAKTAEAERDTLRQRVEGFQRTEITRAAGDLLQTADDIFTAGASVADFLDDDGNVDTDAVRAAASDLLTERPHWGKGYTGDKPPTQRPIEGLRPGALPRDYQPPQLTWRDVLGNPDNQG